MEEIVYGFMVGGGVTAVGVSLKLVFDSFAEYKNEFNSEHKL